MSFTCPIEDWHGCYDDSWRELIVPEAFRHPAKFSRGLITRIYSVGLGRGWWHADSLIGDPFGGIGGGGIIAAACRLGWLGVEIEPRFVALARQNFRLHQRAWEKFRDPQPVIIEGDARRFASIVARSVVGIVTSPPYGDQMSRAHGGADTPHPDGAVRMGCGIKDRYGDTSGQIGSLRTGSIDGVVTSPPYGGNRSIEKNAGTIDFAKNYETYRANGGGSTFESYWQAMAQVYRECFDALRPGGVMAVVMKDYVKDKRVVPLCGDTLTLLERLGFVPILRARAHLVKRRSELTFAGEKTTITERKSFFRRLAESKGSPRIDWEEVLVVRREAVAS